jgi:hypothetical protein
VADRLFEPEVSRSLQWLSDWYRKPVALAIECKRCTTSATLPLDQVKPHQLEALIAFEKQPLAKKLPVAAPVGSSERRFHGKSEFDFIFVGPGKSYVLVNFRFTKKAPRKDIPKGLNKCFALTPTQYLEAVKYCEGVGRKSIPIEWFQENVLELERVKYESGYGWDLSPLVKGVDLTNVS